MRTLRVSIVLPCRNEIGWIANCLQSLIAQEFPQDEYEVIVVDGMSTDGTRDVLRQTAALQPIVRVIDNPARITPIAMNRGVVASRGEIILIAGAHNYYDSLFLQRLIGYLAQYPDADAVGGAILARPRTKGRVGRAIAHAISHPFGVGPSHFRTHPKKPVWVDAAFGCGYRRAAFEKTGLFNERLVRGQDMEFNCRLRKAGGKILLAPDLTSDYFARSTIRSFWSHNFSNGVWAILPFLYSPVQPVALRHLVPMTFVLSLTLAGLGATVLPLAGWLTVGLVGTYGAMTVLASAQVARRQADPHLFPLMIMTFASLHFGYGIGSLWGGLRLGRRWLGGERRPKSAAAWPRLETSIPAERQARTAL